MKKLIFITAFILSFSNCEKLQVADNLPTIIFRQNNDITPTGIYLAAEIDSDSDSDSDLRIDSKGFCWSKNQTPTINDFILVGEEAYNDRNYFFGRAQNLEPGTTYYFRAYANTVQGTGYSEEISINTLPISIPPCELEENVMMRGNTTSSFYSTNWASKEFTAFSLAADLYINFEILPESREFQTGNVDSFIGNRAICTIRGVFANGFLNTTHYAKDGQIIYVEEQANGQLSIQFCDIEMGSSTYTDGFILSGHFIFE